MAEDLKRVKECWQKYRAAVLRQGVAQAKAEGFVRWAQRFAQAVPGVSLRARTEAHGRAFLRDLDSRTHVEAWQVEQAQEALRVPYQHRLPRPWAQPWPLPSHTAETARTLPRRQAFHAERAERSKPGWSDDTSLRSGMAIAGVNGYACQRSGGAR